MTGQGPRDSNERLEFLGDSVLGLVTSEYLYRENPTEHEGQLTKTKSLLVSKAILSRRALAMGLGRFVLMSHSEVESGGRQRLSILADAFESVVGAVYLDQGFEAARAFIHRWLLRDSSEIVADKRHTNYKSHLQEYVQSTFHTHPVYRIRGEAGPDHSKHFQVEVMVGKRVLGEGRGRNKKEAEQAAARDALERLEGGEERRRPARGRRESAPLAEPAVEGAGRPAATEIEGFVPRTRRGRRERIAPAAGAPPAAAEPAALPEEPLVIAPPPLAGLALPEEPDRPEAPVAEVEPPPPPHLEEMIDELGRPEGPLEERHVDPYGFEPGIAPADEWEAAASLPSEGTAGLREPPGEVDEPVPTGSAGPPPVEVEIAGIIDEASEPVEIDAGEVSAAAEASAAEEAEEAHGRGSAGPAEAWGRRGRRRRGRG